MELVFFSQKVCGPCRIVEAFFEEEEVDEIVKTYKLEENPEMFEKYNIKGTPVNILFDEEGKEVARVHGAEIDELEDLVDQI